jgi:hypothetical protein
MASKSYEYKDRINAQKDLIAGIIESEPDFELNIKFYNIKKFPLDDLTTDQTSEPILFHLRNNSFVLTPKSLGGPELKKYLGLRYIEVTHFAFLPCKYSEFIPKFLNIPPRPYESTLIYDELIKNDSRS